MKYTIYWLIDEEYSCTYIGFSDNIRRRVNEHKQRKVKTTKDFSKFRCFRIEEVDNLLETRKREKYWKSSAGRRKLKVYF